MQQDGFSLIELLVTIVVMSILLATAVSFLRVDRASNALAQQADAFSYFYQAVADEAMLTGKLVRIIEEQRTDESTFVAQSRQSAKASWTTIGGNFDQYTLSKPLRLKLSATPTLFPSGQSSSFTATFSIEGENKIIVLDIDAMGRVQRSEATRKSP